MSLFQESECSPVHLNEPCGPMFDNQVTIPDMFVSFLSQKPQINPNYEKVRGESEVWMAQLCRYDEKTYQKHIRADFSYFVSIWARDAGPEELRTICDWMNWIFDFDDLFDEGCFKDNKEEAKRRVQELKEVMKTENSNATKDAEDPLLEVFRTVWHRVAKRSSEGTRRRFVQTMVDYADGVLGQVDVVCSAEQLDEEHFLALRRKTIGAGPCFALIEYFYGLDLPDEFFHHPAVQRLDEIARELIVMCVHKLCDVGDELTKRRQNDALSFPKELAEGMDQNLVALYGRRGIPPQEAYDKIDVLLKARYRSWYLAQADLPQWSETIDRQVQQYVRAMQDVITANMYWSFNTTRYFGKRTDYVRQTRVINVPSAQLIKNGLALPRTRSPTPPNDGDRRRCPNSDQSLSYAKTMINESLSSEGGSNAYAKKIIDAAYSGRSSLETTSLPICCGGDSLKRAFLVVN